ncbi:DUF2779 domain-containing protein [Sulfurovum sp. AR]|uniref:DUF2779 domain-containing protein n=1 Tax=Sulfurovum sp. AR TaxID=1165841 RepID=UPI00025C4CBC|nr:DUF2779 domain-containing protein [Sulfurovum sp. AR]EIF51364.1 hypothetical protein SULAR_03932 [Sulfurovum sp. AR]
MNLSKSLYTRGLQCSKSLWLKKYKADVLTPPDASAKAIFETGDKVGALACQLFPEGKEVPFEGTTFDEKIALTKKWMDEGVQNIYEATFKYDDILVMVDVLHINEDGSVEINEVKSSTEVKEVYLHDASIQYYVLNGLGYDVKKTNIVHINNKYVRDEELEIDKLFSIVDVSDEVLDLQADIPTYLQYFRKQLGNKDVEPDIGIGKHCTDPYDCDAIEYCWNHIPEYSIFNISRLKSDKKFQMYHDGIIEFEHITDISSFSTSQQVQIKSEQTNSSIINKDAIQEFIDGLTYPIYHLDFETFQQAIPEWKGISPFMKIPFQYSLHAEHKDKPLEHYEFLAEEGIDPRYELAKRLVEDIPTDVTVLAYNMGFEKGVIRELAAMFDEFAPELLAIHDNIQDLMMPFQKKDCYVPSMRGSYSIKYVLPALVPEMAQAYKELDSVQNGGDAMQTYAKLAHMEDKEEVARLREALLRYCELDTLAMVKVLEKLKDVT